MQKHHLRNSEIQNCVLQTRFLGLLTFPWCQVSTWQWGCVHLWYPNRHQHTQPACFDCIHHVESVSPPSCRQLSPLQPESGLMLLPYQRWRCLQLQGKPKRDQERGGGRGGGFPLTGWQPTGHRVYLSLAAGLSAGPVNLPDSSLQVPLIPLIQFISLTARMRPLSAGKIKLSPS